MEYNFQVCKLYTFGILNPSGISMYISLCNEPYKYVVTTSINRVFGLSETARPIKNLKSERFHYGRIRVLVINTMSLWKTLCHKSCLIQYNFIFLISFSHEHPFISNGFNTLWCLDYRSKYTVFC